MRNSLGHKITHLQALRGAWNDFLGFHGIASSIRGEIGGIPISRQEVYSSYLLEFAERLGEVTPLEFAREKINSLPDGHSYLELANWLRENVPQKE